VEEARVFIVPLRVESGKTALRAALDEAGLSLAKAAEASGVSKPTIGNLANGKGGVERRKADAIAEALGVPTVRLFAHKDGVPPA
jgi:transcriptional regulator with XRE-family HTH domain